MVCMRAVFVLLLLDQVTMATGKPFCNPGEYEVLGNLSCSRICPAGYYVSRPIDWDHHIGACSQCNSGTFRPHPSEEPRCVPCAQCREADQEVVKPCSATSDQECQCQPGRFFCDSTDCTESCFRCTRCEDGATLQPCSPTSNTVCALNPQSGQPGSSHACLGVSVEACGILISVLVSVLILTIVIAAICYFVVYNRKTGSRNQLRGSSIEISQSRPPTPGDGENTSRESMGSLAPLTSKGPGGAELLPGANSSLAAPGEPGEQIRMLEAPGLLGQAEQSTSGDR